MGLVTWDKPHFKEDEPSRVDVRIEKDATEAKQFRQWDGEIDARDHRDCRACSRKSDPDAVGLTTRGHRAHIVYASAGGTNEPSNRVTLCYRCHNDEHKNRLRFSKDGLAPVNANEAMEFWRKDKTTKQWFLSRREVSPGVVEKD